MSARGRARCLPLPGPAGGSAAGPGVRAEGEAFEGSGRLEPSVAPTPARRNERAV